MRISDWSSDVCSSDLCRHHGLPGDRLPAGGGAAGRERLARHGRHPGNRRDGRLRVAGARRDRRLPRPHRADQVESADSEEKEFSRMIVEQIWTANAYRNFNSLLACPESGQALAIDPRDHTQTLARAKERSWETTQIKQTPTHRHTNS